VATLLEASKICPYRWVGDKNSRLEGHLGQYPLTESVKFTHHSPAKPAVVSTSKMAEQNGFQVITNVQLRWYLTWHV